MNINWYPGHMAKAKRALSDKLKLIDLVIEVLDARAPASSINPDFEAMFAGKRRMYVLNKSDLADASLTRAWVEHFRAEGVFCVAYSAIRGNANRLRQEIESCAGEIYERYRQKGMNKTVRALVCGIPNVGKSAMINRLSGSKKQKEGNMPGVTRGLAWARLTPYLELLDSPGLLWPKIDDEGTGVAIAVIGSIRQEILDEDALACRLVGMLRQTAPALLQERYKLETLEGADWEVLGAICKKRGFLLRGGEADYERGVKTLLEEFRNGKLGRITLERPAEGGADGS